MQQEYWGWDIGGAHLKWARMSANGQVMSVTMLPCPLWQGIEVLRNALREALGAVPANTRVVHGVTMTGELVDAFQSREDGVVRILEQFTNEVAGEDVQVYALPGVLCSVEQAIRQSNRVASANWHAAATAAAVIGRSGLLIDVGSTTTDVIAFSDGEVRIDGRDDAERLRSGELVYTGCVRTPLMALVERVPYNGEWQTVAAEYFATMADVYRVLERLPDNADMMDTADGGEKTVTASARRIMRMLGRDLEAHARGAHVQLCRYLASRQLEQIRVAAHQVLSRIAAESTPTILVGAGVGRFLLPQLAAELQLDYRDFSGLLVDNNDAALHTQVNDCAPAAAVAHLMQSASSAA